MSRIVRSSKYRHVFGKEVKPEQQIDNVNVSRNAWDSNYIAANNTFWAVCWETAGGGSVGVVPMTTGGKLPQQGFPLIAGHKAAVLDVDFNPFNDYILATASEDCYIKIWSIPEGGLKENMTDSVQSLQGHRRKVGNVKFHPTAANVLASTSQDFSVKIWDIATGQCKLTLEGPTDIIQSIAWNYDGSRLATTCKDKKNRIADPRSGKFEIIENGHEGVKGSRVLWVDDKVFTVGFSKGSEREYMLFDGSNLKQILRKGIDNSSGQLMPFYDDDTKMIYLAGKGDGNIRYYEYTGNDEYIYALSEFKSNKPTKGGCFMYKTGLNVSECEVARFLKLEVSKMVPISFTVPRKSDLFQDDIYPDTASGSGESALSTADYFAGKNAQPKKVGLEKGFVAKPKQEVEFVKQEIDDGPQTVPELKAALSDAKNRIAYLEAELLKAKVKN
jgi:coronin-1B/1C/6